MKTPLTIVSAKPETVEIYERFPGKPLSIAHAGDIFVFPPKRTYDAGYESGVFAERERCAKIAESYVGCMGIAQHIRRG